MKNEQILKLAIEKAVKNGFKWKNEMLLERWRKKMSAKEKLELCEEWLELDTHLTFIFSHSFAINFYGKNWKKRLQEQVLEVNPLDYIRKYLRFCYFGVI